jgi:arsenite methyltransferase
VSQDMLFQDEIKDVVRSVYEQIAAGGGERVARNLYDDEELAEVPGEAIAWALGVGNPIRHAGLRPGETVLDLGCGGGIDTILAARRVGPMGRAIGIDLLNEMVDRALTNAREAGVDGWTEFRQGEMEDLPFSDESIDVVVSNGVINLSPRKSRVLAEVYRVLRPGGRMCVADLTVEEDLPPEILTSDSAWAG